MLTGDKIETAINIGVATGLLLAGAHPSRRPIFDWNAMAVKSILLSDVNCSQKLVFCANPLSRDPGWVTLLNRYHSLQVYHTEAA